MLRRNETFADELVELIEASRTQRPKYQSVNY